MPVTLDTRAGAPSSRAKGSKGAPSPLQEAIQAAQLAPDRKMGQIALAAWLGILVLLCLPWWKSEATMPFAIGMPIWCLLAIVGFLMLGPGLVLRKIKANSKNRITGQNAAGVKAVLSKGAPLFGLSEPEAYFDPDAPDARARVLGKDLVFNAPLANVVDPNEYSALAARGLAHLCLGHGRRLGLLDGLGRANPPLLRVLVWPVWIYASLLERLWLPYALQSADRLALVLVRNHALLLAAILKEYAAGNPPMIAAGVTSPDISLWISQRSQIGGKGEEISTQYKLGRAIHENPVLENRLQNLQRWSGSPEFQGAVEKLAKR